MNKITKKKWIDALRSGKYEQGTHALCRDGKYCCLGVLAKITGNLGNAFSSIFPRMKDSQIQPFCGLSPDVQAKLAQMNDDKRLTFKQIASYISRNIKGT